MKFVILGLIFSSISFLGFKMGNKYYEKEKFYNDFYNFIIFTKNQIGFLKINIIEILNNYETKNKNLKNLLINYYKFLQGEEYTELNILNKDENLEIFNFLKGIGLNDCLTQNEFFENYLIFFEKKLKEVKTLNLKYGAMYKKLGILLGICVCILLI